MLLFLAVFWCLTEFSFEELRDFQMFAWSETPGCQRGFDWVGPSPGCRSQGQMLLDLKSQIPSLEWDSGWGRAAFCSMRMAGPCFLAGRQDPGRDSWLVAPHFFLTKGILFGMRRTTRWGFECHSDRCAFLLCASCQARLLFFACGGELCCHGIILDVVKYLILFVPENEFYGNVLFANVSVISLSLSNS